MSQIDNQNLNKAKPVNPTVVSTELCERLYLEQAKVYQSKALGLNTCLPSSARAQQYRKKSWHPTQHPWLVDLEQSAQLLRCLLWVDPQLEYFAGHFPAHPILPGVVQLDWSLQLAQQQWPRTHLQDNFNGVQNLKFKAPVYPAELLELVLTHQQGKIVFVLSSPSEVRSQGTLLYRA